MNMKKLVRFGYAEMQSPSRNLLFHRGERLHIHEFHHWDSTENGAGFTAVKANGSHWDFGFANDHLYAGFPHFYWMGTPLPYRFVKAAADYRTQKGQYHDGN